MTLTKINLWGELGSKFTPQIQANVSTPREAIACLSANFPEFKSYILESDCRYSLIVRRNEWQKELTPNDANFPILGSELTIIPVIEGSGGFFQGLALIGIGLLTGGTGFILAGIAMGLQSIFNGNPAGPKNPEQDDRSIIFQSGDYNVAEGNTIPIPLGICYLTSPQVISYEVTSDYKTL